MPTPKHKQIRQMRIMMGIKSQSMAEIVGISSTRYSQIENAPVGFRKNIYIPIKKMFDEWRRDRIMSLKEEIKYLEELYEK